MANSPKELWRNFYNGCYGMGIYRLTFVNNEVVSCSELSNKYELYGPYQYGHLKGWLIYAIVRAGNEMEAEHIGYQIAGEVQQRVGITWSK